MNKLAVFILFIILQNSVHPVFMSRSENIASVLFASSLLGWSYSLNKGILMRNELDDLKAKYKNIPTPAEEKAKILTLKADIKTCYTSMIGCTIASILSLIYLASRKNK